MKDAQTHNTSGPGQEQNIMQLDQTGDETESQADSPAAENNPTKTRANSNIRQLNPRSCITCRRRKVRCDKTHPCANCVRQHIDCIFPAPGRAPRKVKKVADGGDKELLDRLRRLEGVVKNLGVDVTGLEGAEVEAAAGKTLPQDHEEAGGFKDRIIDESADQSDNLAAARFENRFGRLVINDGKSRYVTSTFWANLSNEVEDLKGILNQSSSEEEDYADSTPAPSRNHHEFVFGFSSQDIDLLSYHPATNKIPVYWRVFKENVDPVVKVLHVPTVEQTVLSAASHLGVLSRSFETLMFSVYYGAVTTLTPEDCMTTFGEPKPLLIARYRFSVEQSLARANFLITEELVVLQAFIVFLICLRKNSGARIIWTLTGLVVRMAQTMGIHRDGSHFNLSPFETEMRRRAWWQICLLDTRASEDHGCDPTIVESAFDTKLPLNINDNDISPDSKSLPAERQGCVDTTFSLIRCEVSNTFRRINYIPPGPTRSMNVLTSVTLEEKEKWITQSHHRLEEKYLKNVDMTVPLYWVTATVARLIMSKMWLMVYHPYQRKDGGQTLPQETKDKLFITSLENMEYSLLLATEARTQRWSWLFKTYMQWHALAFTLNELCTRTKGDLVDRAWVAVEKMRHGRWGDVVSDGSKGGHLWRPLRKLYRKALDARTRDMLSDQQNVPARTYSPNANPMFGHPKRPQMTRAPLSQAQLDRFIQGPSFGDFPADSHQLLKSPRGSDACKEPDAVQPLDLSQSGMQAAGLFDQGAYDMIANTTQGPQLGTLAPQAPLLFGQRFSGPEQMTFANTDMPVANTMESELLGVSASRGSQSTPETLTLAGMDGIDTNMDAAGDINWENWDQMVQQYGMEIDRTDGTFGWADLNWNSNSMQGQQDRRLGSESWFI